MPGNRKSAHVLLVEGEVAISEPLARALRQAGFTTTIAATGTRGLAMAQADAPDVVLVDLVLPDANGHDVCDELKRHSDAPIVMLATDVTEADRDAWRDGADDYVLKPIRLAETIARVRAVLRRAEQAHRAVMHLGPLEIDGDLGEVRLDGTDVPLTRKELALLVRLAQAAGEVVTREQLMHDVWGTDWVGETKTLDVHVGWLRKKLGEDPHHPRFIHTVRGVGFRMPSREELEASSATGDGDSGAQG